MKSTNKKKTYVLDTNVLISDPGSIYAFEENDVVIPLTVIRELDGLKSRPGEVGQNSRLASRRLNEYRSKYPGAFSKDGVIIDEDREKSGMLKIFSDYDALWDENHMTGNRLEKDVPDDQIIMTALAVKRIAENKDSVVLVSNDFNVLLKADYVGMKCEEYKNIRISESSQMYSGCANISVIDKKAIDNLYDNLGVNEQSVVGHNELSLYPNQYVVVTDEIGNSFLGRFFKKNCEDFVIEPLIKESLFPVFGLSALNKEQKFAFDALLDDSIKLVTLIGPSGTGKTILAVAAGLEQTTGSSKFERLIVTRPVEPIGRDLGFLPGTFEEKMLPWIQPIYDNISFLTSQKSNNRMTKAKKYDAGKKKIRNVNEHDIITNRDPYVAELQDAGRLEIEAITYIRGRSIPRSFIIVDEAQNLSMHALKTLITRAGEGTKIVLTGDVEQIDNVHVDTYTNGLSHAVEKFKYSEMSAHVTLTRGQRSELATLASKIL